jgi:hypothetical protein
MPVHRRQVGDFSFGFLDAVLREVRQPDGDGRPDAISRNRLGNSQELYRCRVAADATTRVRDSSADRLEALS